MDSSPNSLRSGDTLGPYRIEGLIGQGGMGEVYRGTDTRLGRPVAIKVSTQEFSDRFEREARAISALNHPNICTLYDVGPNYLVMELVEGDTLSQILSRGPLPLDRTLEYAGQIADALAAAHAKGIVHRDLKPGNIIVTPNGVKVLDFGLAKLSASTLGGDANPSNVATLTTPITESGSIVGTLYYMAPEQVEAKDADERSDIFAFGAVLYEMITGQRAFDGDTRAAVMAAVMKDQPVPVRQLRPEAPRSLERLVRKCLEKKPDDRWQTARDLKPILEMIDLDASTASLAGVPSGSSASGSAVYATPSRRSWLLGAVAVVVVLAVAGLAAWTLWPTAEPAARVTRFEVPVPEGTVVNPGTFYVRVSPDGTKLAFITEGEQAGIWVRDLESVEARLLPGTEGAAAPFWSPDSRSLAFGVANRLMRVEVSGGPPRALAESTFPVGSGFWTPDGEIVFGARGNAPLQRVSQAGGVPSPVTALAEGETLHSLPSLLPDGRHFLYLRLGVNTGLYVGSLDLSPEDQSVEQVAPAQFGSVFVRSGNSRDGHLFFLRDGTLMAQVFDTDTMRLTGDPIPVAQGVGTGTSHGHFSVTASGVLAYRAGDQRPAPQLTWVDREGQPLNTVGDPTGSLSAVTLSPDGTQAVLFRGPIGSGDLWVLDLERDIETRITFDGNLSLLPGPGRPVWSPDSLNIAYGRGNQILAKLSSGAGEAQTLVDSEAIVQPMDWSREGRALIFLDPAHTGIAALPTGESIPTGEPAVVVSGQQSLPALGTVSPDGRWIAYASQESGRSEVYIQPFSAPGQPGPASAGAKWQVSRDGGTVPRWRGDGEELFFLNGGALMAAEIEVAGDALRPSAPVQLFVFSNSLANSLNWDVSRDGQRFLVAMPPGAGADSPITVVENWEEALTP